MTVYAIRLLLLDKTIMWVSMINLLCLFRLSCDLGILCLSEPTSPTFMCLQLRWHPRVTFCAPFAQLGVMKSVNFVIRFSCRQTSLIQRWSGQGSKSPISTCVPLLFLPPRETNVRTEFTTEIRTSSQYQAGGPVSNFTHQPERLFPFIFFLYSRAQD